MVQLCVCRVHSGGSREVAKLSRTLRGGPGGSERITEEMGRNHQNACTSVAPATWLNSQGAPGFTF